jgi:hypothetical protein
MDLRAILKALTMALTLRPQLKDDGDFANNTYVDTLGLSGLLFLFLVGDTDVAAGAAIGSTAEGTAPKIEECDTTGGSYSDVTGAALANSIQYDEDNKLFGIFLDLAKTHKRYMRVNAPHSAAGAANGSNLAVLAIGFPADQFPRNAAQMGLTELIEA